MANSDLKAQAQQIFKLVKANKSDDILVQEFYKLSKQVDDTPEKEWLEGIEKADAGRIHANLAAAHLAFAIKTSTTRGKNAFVKYIGNVAGATTNSSSVYIKIEGK